jgi:N utilization substance protein B
MASRHGSRRLALQVLFGMDATGEAEELTWSKFTACFEPSAEAVPFARELVRGVGTHRDEIDRRLAQVSRNWRLGRMDRVDRNVLRLGAYELLFRDDVPAKVAINEAVELAKEFGAEHSGAFVNGILDALRRAGDEAEARRSEEPSGSRDPGVTGVEP